ncbi:MAG: ABC transporter ATP-binding protein [Chlamydiales bacterium]|nr:ABC transporter ATP-binding protein [Chlamydiales bacterium]
MADDEYILEADDLHKAFYHPTKVTLLQGINLRVSRGETVAIMGRSGEGKSTLLHVLGTLEPPCRGQITIAGLSASAMNRSQLRSRHIGFVFQSFHLLEDYTVLENVLMPARIDRHRTAKGSAAYLRACQLLERVGMSGRMDFNTKLLSGGEKQRVSLARALCNNPDLIFADEPSGNLDKDNSRKIHELLMSLAAEDGKAVVIVTHDPELAALCSTRYRLTDGVLVASA